MGFFLIDFVLLVSQFCLESGNFLSGVGKLLLPLLDILLQLVVLVLVVSNITFQPVDGGIPLLVSLVPLLTLLPQSIDLVVESVDGLLLDLVLVFQLVVLVLDVVDFLVQSAQTGLFVVYLIL